MKKIFLFSFLLAGLLNGCDEENNLVQLTPPKNANDQLILVDSSTTSAIPPAQLKNVLIEDFTAVHCDNCPNAQHWCDIISSQNPGRVSVLGIHSTSLAIPGAGFFDFRTTHGDDLINYLGTYPGLPIGDVDRKIYKGNSSPLMTYSSWYTQTPNELALNSIANMEVKSKTFDAISGTLNLDITVTFTQSSPESYYFSTALIETGMIGKQQTPNAGLYPPDGVEDTFRFEHVLRKFMDPFLGLKITDAPVAGKSYEIKFQTVLDPKWVADNCSIVAFVHQKSAIRNDVEQVLETTVK